MTTTTCNDRGPGLPSLLCSRPAGHGGAEHRASYGGQVVSWPVEDFDPLFSEVAEHQDRARQLYDEALGEQLMRGFLAAGRSDTVRQLVRDLFAAGFTMHDCRGSFGRKHEGGVCLVPLSQVEGIAVSWAQHDVSYESFGGHQDVQEVCNDWLRDLLTVIGWRVEDFGTAGAFRVTGKVAATDEPSPPARHCGHESPDRGDAVFFTCEKPPGHIGWHAAMGGRMGWP